jgi:hypothetical protein
MSSKDAATHSLRTIFRSESTTSISFTEVIEAWGRTGYSEKQNRIWLSNKLVPWRAFGWIRTIYIPNPDHGRHGRLVDRIELTAEGERALDRLTMPLTDATMPAAAETTHIGLHDVMRLFERLKVESPDTAVSLDMEMKVTGRDANGDLLVTLQTAHIEVKPRHRTMDVPLITVP